MSLALALALLLVAQTASGESAPTDAKAADAKAAAGLQALVTTADDEQISAPITALADGQLTLGTEPARTLALDDVARIDVGQVAATALGSAELVWMGQDNHDLVQVGGASGGNGVQDLHLHASNLRAVGLRQITVVCRLPGQLRVWRLDTSQSPHWRLAIARADLAPEADLYLEPPSVDCFGHKLEVKYTYSDGVTTDAGVVAATHTSDQRKIDRRVRAGTRTDKVAAPTEQSVAEVYLADAAVLRGELREMNAETLSLHTAWGADVEVPLLEALGVWFGNVGPAGAQAEFRKQMTKAGADDQVFVLAPDKTMTSIQAGLRSLGGDKLGVHFEGQDRTINRDRVLGVVFAAHPPLPKPAGTRQRFVLSSGETFSGRWIGFADGKLEIELPWKARVSVPGKEFGQIRILGGRVTSLADLEPVEVAETPYFGRTISWQRDAGFDGEPPRLRGKQPMRVLAVHSRTVLTYALDAEYEKFKVLLGFDDSAAARGRVNCRILVDGRETFAKQDFRADADPMPVEISVAGAKQLTLEVDFGPAEDVGDRVLWAEPRLFRAAEK